MLVYPMEESMRKNTTKPNNCSGIFFYRHVFRNVLHIQSVNCILLSKFGTYVSEIKKGQRIWKRTKIGIIS